MFLMRRVVGFCEHVYNVYNNQGVHFSMWTDADWDDFIKKIRYPLIDFFKFVIASSH